MMVDDQNNGIKVSSPTPQSPLINGEAMKKPPPEFDLSREPNGTSSSSSFYEEDNEKECNAKPQATPPVNEPPEPPQPAQRQQHHQRRARKSSIRSRMLRGCKLMKSTSTPSLHKLDVSLSSIAGFNHRSENSHVQREDFGRPLMAQRRSLSPKTSSASRTEFCQAPPTRLEENIFQDFAAEPPYVPVDIPDVGSRRGMGRAMSARRASMPDHLAETMRGSSEVMDPNAMRYLPKILRDTYAQRQTRRSSLVSF